MCLPVLAVAAGAALVRTRPNADTSLATELCRDAAPGLQRWRDHMREHVRDLIANLDASAGVSAHRLWWSRSS